MTETIQYDVVLFGGSIGTDTIRNKRDLIDRPVQMVELVTNDKDNAIQRAKRLNKLLSKGEKEYYKLKYRVVQVADGLYTGK
jgi:hypothetical protein